MTSTNDEMNLYRLNNLWKRIADKIYIISLEESEDRRDKMIKELDRVGIKDYSFYIVKKDNEDTKRGCFLSHKNIIMESCDSMFERILILEDDAYFIKSLSKLSCSLEEIVKWLDLNHYRTGFVDIFFLGHLPIHPLKPVGGCSTIRIVKTTGSRYTHCYLITRSGMDKISQMEYTGKHYDAYTSVLEGNYAIYPMISYQDDVASENDYNTIYRIFSDIRNKISCKRLCKIAEKICYFKGTRLISDCIEQMKTSNIWKKISGISGISGENSNIIVDSDDDNDNEDNEDNKNNKYLYA